MNTRQALGLLAHIVYRRGARYTLGTAPMDDEAMRALERAGKKPDGPIVVPVWAYIHGSTALAARPNSSVPPGYPFDCPWDAGRSGFAYCTREDAREFFGWPKGSPITAARRARIVATLISDVAAFSDHLNNPEE